MSRRAFRLVIAGFAAALLAWATWALVCTAAGLRLVAAALAAGAPGALELQVESGSLKAGFRLRRLDWQAGDFELLLENAEFRLDLVPLLAGGLIVESLQVDSGRLRLQGGGGWPARVPDLPRPPVAVELRDLRLERLVTEDGGGQTRVFERLHASALWPAAGAALLDASLRAATVHATLFGQWGQAAPDGLDVEFHWRTLPDRAVAAQGSGRLWGQGSSLQVTHQLVAPVQAALDGNLQLAAGTPRWDARLALPEGQRLPWPAGIRLPSLPALQFELAGESFDQCRITAEAPCAFAGLAGARCKLRATATANELTVQSLGIVAGDARLEASGRAWWPQGRPRWQWQFGARVQGFNPGQVQPAATGRLDFELEGDGEALTGQLRLSRLSGELRGHAVRGEASGRIEEGALVEANAELRAGRASLSLASESGWPRSVAWRFDIPALGELVPAARGALRGQGSWRVGATGPVTRGTLEAADLALAKHAADALSLRWDLDGSTPDRAPSLQLSARGVRVAGVALEGVAAGLRGTPDRQVFDASLQAASGTLVLAAMGGPDARGVWRGELREARWQPLAGLPLALQKPASIEAGRAGGSLGNACWSGAGEACFDAAVGSDRAWRVRARFAGFDSSVLDRQFSQHGPGAGPRASGDISLSGRAAALEAWDGRLQVELPVGALRRASTVELAPLSIELGTTTEALALAASTAITNPVPMPLTLRLATPRRAPLAGWAQWPLQGSLRGDLASLAPLAERSDEFAEVDGSAALDLRISGTPEAPVLAGGATLDVAHLHFTRFGVALTDLQLTARGRPDGRLGIDGGFKAGEGKVELTGVLGVDRGTLAADLVLEGERVRFVDLPEASALASGSLRLQLAPGHASVRGELVVPEANLKLRERAVATRRSPDVVVEGMTSGRQAVPPLEIALALTLGKAVALEAGGFSGRLTGQLALAARPNAALLATGRLDIEDGRYTRWGETLALRDSRLLFADQPPADPRIDARAEREVGSVTAGLRVTGRLREPEARLYSNPTLPEVDVLSYLIAGQPLSGAASTDARNLLGAAASMGLRGSGLLSQKVASAFGLDTLQVGTRTSGRGPALDVGKFISPQLYVGYGAGLLERANTFRLRYLLGKRWSIEAETGSRSGADLLYSIER